MINISASFKSKFKQDDIKIGVEIRINEKVYNNSNILSETLSLTESLSTRDCFEFSDVESSQIKFTLINDGDIDDLTDQIAYITLIVDDEALPYGVYKISAEKSGDLILCTGIDLFYKLDVNVASWYNDLTFPITHKNMVISLCEYVGLEYDLPIAYTNHNISITKSVSLSDISGREMLGFLNELACGWFTLNRIGKVVLVQLSSSELYPSETLYPSTTLYPAGVGERYYPSMFAQENIDISEFVSAQVDKLVIRSSESDIGTIVGDGTNAYIIEGNILTYGFDSSQRYAIATEIYNVLSGIQYSSVKGDFIGLPYLEKGDFIQVTDQDNHVGKTFLLNRTLNGIVALIDSIDILASYKRNEVSAVNREFKILKNKTNELYRTIDTLSSTITDVEADLQSQITQNAGNINLKVSKNDVINQINISTEGISINANKINLSGYATFYALETSGATTINGSNITTGTLNASLITSGTMNANRIRGGTISGTKFEVGSSGSTGTITFTSGPVLYSSNSSWVTLAGSLLTNHLVPNANATYSLGISVARWESIWCTQSSLNTSSDRRLKDKITDIYKGIELIYSLEPKQYTLKDGQSGRIHYGFIAQDVKSIMTKVGIDDCALYVDNTIKDGETIQILALRYGELIAPMIQAIQDLNMRLKKMENT